MDKEHAMLTRAQAAQRLGVSPERIRQLTVTGRLRCIQTPLGRLYHPADVLRLAEQRRGLETSSA
jgi:predicted site-specific integrase-resolvase